MTLPIMIDFPLPIITPRLLLRAPRMGYSDAREYVEAATESTEALSKWLPYGNYFFDTKSSEKYIRESCANWILKTDNCIGLPIWITNKITGEFIGHMVLWNIDWNMPKFEIGFWVRTSCAQKGYITEATNALTRYCLSQHGAKIIELTCEPENIRSSLVPQRLGFTFRPDIHKENLLVFHCTNIDTLPNLEVYWPKQ